jgi:hypothetical protein
MLNNGVIQNGINLRQIFIKKSLMNIEASWAVIMLALL